MRIKTDRKTVGEYRTRARKSSEKLSEQEKENQRVLLKIYNETEAVFFYDEDMDFDVAKKYMRTAKKMYRKCSNPRDLQLCEKTICRLKHIMKIMNTAYELYISKTDGEPEIPNLTNNSNLIAANACEATTTEIVPLTQHMHIDTFNETNTSLNITSTSLFDKDNTNITSSQETYCTISELKNVEVYNGNEKVNESLASDHPETILPTMPTVKEHSLNKESFDVPETEKESINTQSDMCMEVDDDVIFNVEEIIETRVRVDKLLQTNTTNTTTSNLPKSCKVPQSITNTTSNVEPGNIPKECQVANKITANLRKNRRMPVSLSQDYIVSMPHAASSSQEDGKELSHVVQNSTTKKSKDVTGKRTTNKKSTANTNLLASCKPSSQTLIDKQPTNVTTDQTKLSQKSRVFNLPENFKVPSYEPKNINTQTEEVTSQCTILSNVIVKSANIQPENNTDTCESNVIMNTTNNLPEACATLSNLPQHSINIRPGGVTEESQTSMAEKKYTWNLLENWKIGGMVQPRPVDSETFQTNIRNTGTLNLQEPNITKTSSNANITNSNLIPNNTTSNFVQEKVCNKPANLTKTTSSVQEHREVFSLTNKSNNTTGKRYLNLNKPNGSLATSYKTPSTTARNSTNLQAVNQFNLSGTSKSLNETQASTVTECNSNVSMSTLAYKLPTNISSTEQNPTNMTSNLQKQFASKTAQTTQSLLQYKLNESCSETQTSFMEDLFAEHNASMKSQRPMGERNKRKARGKAVRKCNTLNDTTSTYTEHYNTSNKTEKKFLLQLINIQKSADQSTQLLNSTCDTDINSSCLNTTKENTIDVTSEFECSLDSSMIPGPNNTDSIPQMVDAIMAEDNSFRYDPDKSITENMDSCRRTFIKELLAMVSVANKAPAANRIPASPHYRSALPSSCRLRSLFDEAEQTP